MKTIVSILASFAIFGSVSASGSTGQPLDGREYIVISVDGPDVSLETPDNLVFRNGLADAPVCHMYGFYSAPYETKEVDGEIQFCFTSESETEGTVVFKGSINGDQMNGSYVWKKEGREDLEYTFTAKAKS